jgi:hypothetical protein
VLIEPVGLARDCWAWSDDPDWERVADAATQAYRMSSHASQSLSKSRKELAKKRVMDPPEA